VPGEACQVILWVIVAEIVEQKKRIEIPGFAKTEGALQLDAGTLDGRLRLKDLSNWAERHRLSSFLGAQRVRSCALRII
jgi:hypothetical protein